MTDRIARQMEFLVEADKLKAVLRRTPLTDNSRRENTAEHSWHLALAALALVEHAPAGVDLGRVMQLVAVHDLVEIDAGDTFAYDVEAYATPESRFANALDRLQGLLQNLGAGGGSWITHGVKRSQILKRMEPVEATLPELWPFVTEVVDRFCASGAIVSD